MSNMIDQLYASHTLFDLILRMQETYPQRDIVTIERENEARTFTYDEIVKESQKLIPTIKRQTNVGDRVVIATGTSQEFIISFFACLLSGRIAVPVPIEKMNSRYSRLGSVLKDCNPKLILFRTEYDREIMIGVDSFLNQVKSFVFENGVMEGSDFSFVTSIDENAVALIQYTSGSTSSPKGVVLTHKNIISNLRMIQVGMNVTGDDRIVSWLPLHHDMGLIGMLLTFFSTGAHTLIYPYQEFSRNPVEWLKKIEKFSATLSGAPNFAFDIVAKKLQKGKSSPINLEKLRLLYCGSERIQKQSIERFYASKAIHNLSVDTFFPCYGLAEASLYVSGDHVNPSQLLIHTDGYPSCGTIANGIHVKILDNKGNSIAPGSPGLIHLSGDSISPGYWSEIADSINQGQVGTNRSSYLNTGDLGYIKNQHLVITGRRKDLIKIRGRNIYPEDIENLIENKCKYFSTNSVVAFGDLEGETEVIKIVAEIERSYRKIPAEIIFSSIQKILSAEGFSASEICVVSPMSLPKTSSGKKQRLLTKKKFDSKQLKVIHHNEVSQVQFDNLNFTEDNLDLIELELRDNIDFGLANERRTFPANLLVLLKKHNLLTCFIDKRVGGLQLTSSDFLKIGRRLGKIDLTLGSLVGNHNTIGILPIVKSENFDRKEEVLNAVANDGAMAAFALTEPSAGANPRGMKSVVNTKSGKILLNGEKVWIGNAGIARFITVFAKEEIQGEEKGISAFLLDKHKHKFQVCSEQLTLGLKAMPQNRLKFHDVELTEEDRLSLPGRGLDLAFYAMDYARFGLLALAVGGIEAALEKVSLYARSRDIWGGRLYDNDVFRLHYRDFLEKKNLMLVLAKHIAFKYDTEGKVDPGLSLTAKIICGEWTFEIIDMMLQFSGGRGFTETFGLSCFFRDSRVLRIFEGPTEALASQLGSIVLRQNASELFPDAPRNFVLSFTDALKSIVETGAAGKNRFIEYIVGRFAAEAVIYGVFINDNPDQESRMIDLLGMAADSYRIKLMKYQNVSVEETVEKVQYPKDAAPHYDTWSGWEIWTDEKKVRKNVREINGDDRKFLKTQSSQPDGDILGPDDLKKILNWVQTHTRHDVVDANISLSSYGLDSLLAYELLCFVEEEFGVNLPDTIISDQPSLNKLVEIINNLKMSNPQKGSASNE